MRDISQNGNSNRFGEFDLPDKRKKRCYFPSIKVNSKSVDRYAVGLRALFIRRDVEIPPTLPEKRGD